MCSSLFIKIHKISIRKQKNNIKKNRLISCNNYKNKKNIIYTCEVKRKIAQN